MNNGFISMNTIQPNKPRTAFDFTQAVTQPFQSPEGRGFAWRLLFWISAGLSIVMLIAMPVFLKHYPAIMEYNWQNMQSVIGDATPPEPQQLFEVFMAMWPAYLFQTLGSWAVLVAGETALHRKLLRGEERARIPVGLGREELRVWLSQIGVIGLWFFGYILALFIIMSVSGALMVVSKVLGGITIFFGILALIAFLAWLPIRIAPAAALSVQQGRTHVLAARKVTKNRFWSLFLSYFVVGIGGYVAIYLVGSICILLVTGNSDVLTAMSGMSDENPRVVLESLSERFKNPLIMLLGVLSVILYSTIIGLWYMCYAGIGTYAVKWWRSDNPEAMFG